MRRPAPQVEQVGRVDARRGARDRQQLLARRRQRRAERALEALCGARDRDLRARRADRPAGRGHGARSRRRRGRRGGQRERRRARAGRGEGGGSGHRKLRNPGGDIRRGAADGTGAAAIVAADGHRLAFDGGAGHDATDPRAARGGDRRRGRRAAPARLRAVVPQLRRALRARVGARHRRGADAGLHRPLRADPAPARDRWSRCWRCRSARTATRSWCGPSCSASACWCGSPTGSAPSSSPPRWASWRRSWC